MLKPPYPAAIKRIYIEPRRRGCTQGDACRICDLHEHTIRKHEKTDPVLANAEQAATGGRASVTASICGKAIEALKDPHDRNPIH